MKIRVLSDLHLEFEKMVLRNEGEDLLILCGDILPLNIKWGRKSRNRYLMKNFLKRYLQTCPNYDKDSSIKLILVLGNHDYYASKINLVMSFYYQLNNELPGFKCLMNDKVILSDPIDSLKKYLFIGSTLWGNLENLSKDDLRLIGNKINDFHCIYDKKDKLINTNFIKKVHKQNKDFIKNILQKDIFLNENETLVKCVITHHLISYQSVNPKFRDQKLLNYAYVGDLEDLCGLTDYFFHGHTHSSNDYYLENCGIYSDKKSRVISNPKGYKGENTEFNLRLIIDI